jgi:uncharacterized protein (DUF1697 family)
MASVLFFRGVNVGGHKTFRPSELARKLAHLDAVSIGAAGTFVIRRPVSKAAIQTELKKHLKFDAEVMMCPGREVLDLVESPPFDAERVGPTVKRYATVLAKRSLAGTPVPFLKPDGPQWQVKIIRITSRWVLSLHRRMGKRLIYPNEVVEGLLDMSATTRNWNTILAIAETLRNNPPRTRR